MHIPARDYTYESFNSKLIFLKVGKEKREKRKK
jgi:hypothetical protein